MSASARHGISREGLQADTFLPIITFSKDMFRHCTFFIELPCVGHCGAVAFGVDSVMESSSLKPCALGQSGRRLGVSRGGSR